MTSAGISVTGLITLHKHSGKSMKALFGMRFHGYDTYDTNKTGAAKRPNNKQRLHPVEEIFCLEKQVLQAFSRTMASGVKRKKDRITRYLHCL